MKKVQLILLSQFMLQITFAQKTDFTGNWSIDTSKSDFGSAPLFVVPAEISVQQTADSLFLSVVNIDDKGSKSTASAKYPLNGNAIEKEFQTDVKLIGSLQWTADQNHLAKSQRFINAAQSEDPFRKVKEMWSLSNDGRYLTIEQSVEIADADGYAVKAVYEKKW